MYTDANIVMGAESADFFFDSWYGNEINKPLHSNRHVPIVTHVGGSHTFLDLF
jgi:hypothetical protein